MTRASRFPLTALLAALLAPAVSCGWVSLATHALNYDAVGRGEAANVAAFDSTIYATKAEDGFSLVDAATGATFATIAPPAGSESVDDIAVADSLLFVLDARAPGHLSVFSIRDPHNPVLVSPPREVPVGPFSGITAAGGLCIVSGGTSSLTTWRYDRAGALSDSAVATTDLGRGQPDVLLSRDGRLGFVSTHYWGVSFGLDVISLGRAGAPISLVGELKIRGAGFTDGGSKPANFPIESAQLGGDTVVVAYAEGLAVIAAPPNGAPRLLARVPLDAPAVNVDAADGRAAVVVGGADPALIVVRFAHGEARIERLIAMDPSVHPAGVVMVHGRAAVAARGRGVLVYDL